MPKGRKAHGTKPSVAIPKRSGSKSSSSQSSPVTPKTPKTPADEGIEFFESYRGETPIQVYELRLESDGAPHKDRSVSTCSLRVSPSLKSSRQYIRLPPACVPYILRVSIDAGTPAAKNGVFKTNFPLDGGKFGRDKFTKRE
jgi:glycogen debranching enzyme